MKYIEKNPEEFELMINLLEHYYRELLFWKASGSFSSWVTPDEKKKLTAHFEKWHPNKKARSTVEIDLQPLWIQEMNRLQSARKALYLPINRKLLAQSLLFQWAHQLSSLAPKPLNGEARD